MLIASPSWFTLVVYHVEGIIAIIMGQFSKFFAGSEKSEVDLPGQGKMTFPYVKIKELWQ